MVWTDWQKAILALVMWREARGEGKEGMQAVGCVVRNRAGDMINKIEAKWQFSSLTAPGDPMLIQWPADNDPQFAIAMELAEGINNWSTPDITHGATHYFNPSVVLPSWAATMTKVATIGHHDFYR